MKKIVLFLIAVCTFMTLLTARVVWAQKPHGTGQASTNTASTSDTDEQRLEELNRQLQNPISSVWSLTFQFNNFFLNGFPSDKTRVQDVLNFQPVIPLHLTKNWNLISRPIFPFIFTTPTFTERVEGGGGRNLQFRPERRFWRYGLFQSSLAGKVRKLASGNRPDFHIPDRQQRRTWSGKVSNRPGGGGWIFK